jgi:DNA primase
MRLSVSQKEFLIRAAHLYAKNVDKALPYLEERGLSPQDVSPFHLGVVVEPLPSHEQFIGRLSIPYITRSGVVDIRFRALDNSEPKYMGMTGAETTLFNVESLFKAKNYICLCEGEMDTITMATKTQHPAVGAPGAASWKTHYSRIFEDFDVVLVLADGDEAGLEFGKRIQRAVANVRILQMPEGEDVNSVVLKKGTEYLDERIRQAI